MPLTDKIHQTVILTTVALATICTSALAQQDSLYQENQTARLEKIDAALAKAELGFFEQPPAPAFVAQEPPPESFSSTEENTFGVSESQSRDNVPDATFPKHTFEAGAEVFFYKYEEPDFAKTFGTWEGVYTNYSYRPSAGDLLHTNALNIYKLEGRYGWGEVDYKGSGTTNNIKDWSTELRGLLGKEYIHNPYSTTLYAGFGYRYLLDDGGGRLSSTGNYGYDRESRYFYLPAGLEFTNHINDAWSIAFLGEYDWLIHGLQISHLSDGDQFNNLNNDDIENPQHNGFGARLSLRIVRESDIMDFIFEPFARYWNIADSEVTFGNVDGKYAGFLEPANTTIEGGMKVGVRF